MKVVILKKIINYAPVAQRIEYLSSEQVMWVRFLPGALEKVSHETKSNKKLQHS